ncbi:MAG: GntR family transcriptional regulator [Clostridiales bacterium]|nr:GntR family transcriptional regulator [Roseburia sp.]MDD7637450.1 GntR family transcriptional regulator [Clostridiales bacterium]MDY4113261.1 GntR family transcriptional regulator [Roseburia sp.]
MAWNLDSDRPIFLQIVERIQMDIISGKYAPGDKLPSVRDLAGEAAVNPNTMQKAFTELERTGLVYSMRTSGRYITEDTTMIEELKASLAREKINEFLELMQKLGYKNEEILSLMNQTMKGDTK